MNSKKQANEQAQANLESIKDIMERLDNADNQRDRAYIDEEIHEMPLSVQVSGSARPMKDIEPERYTITLTTGGPHVEITGNLRNQFEPADATLKAYSHNEECTISSGENASELLEFARMFYYGSTGSR